MNAARVEAVDATGLDPRRRPVVVSLAALLAGSAVALSAPRAGAQGAPDPLAGLDAAQRRAVQAALKKQGAGGAGDAQADSALRADLDGDGAAELVLLWLLLGPSSGSYSVTVFKQSGTTWREAASYQVGGSVGRMQVIERQIVLDTLVLGPRDARCCPSVKKTVRLRWAGQTLQAVRS